MALTGKQEIFCKQYLENFNATKAAKLAGYSEKTAYATGWENLRKPEIKKRLDELIKEREEFKPTHSFLIDILLKIIADPSASNNEQIRAIETIGKHTGFFKEDNVREENITIKKVIDWGDITDEGIEKIIAAIKGA